MKKQILTLAVLSATSLTFLTACGSSPSADTNGVVGLPPTLSDRIASHRELGSFSNGGDPDDSSNNTFDYTYSQTEDTFTLHSRGDNLIMTVNGVEHVLTLADGGVDYWRDSNNSNISITELRRTYSGDDNIIDTLAETDSLNYGTVVFYEVDTNLYRSGGTDFDVDYRYGYATAGIQTPASVVREQTATATYGGHIGFITDPARKNAPNVASQESFSGTMSMEVNFNERTIGGTATFRRSDNTFNENAITFAQTRINGNGFEGTFTINDEINTVAQLTGNPVGIYAGNFFGPNADDLAGVMQLNGTNANGAVFGHGGFRADRQGN